MRSGNNRPPRPPSRVSSARRRTATTRGNADTESVVDSVGSEIAGLASLRIDDDETAPTTGHVRRNQGANPGREAQPIVNISVRANTSTVVICSGGHGAPDHANPLPVPQGRHTAGLAQAASYIPPSPHRSSRAPTVSTNAVRRDPAPPSILSMPPTPVPVPLGLPALAEFPVVGEPPAPVAPPSSDPPSSPSSVGSGGSDVTATTALDGSDSDAEYWDHIDHISEPPPTPPPLAAIEIAPLAHTAEAPPPAYDNITETFPPGIRLAPWPSGGNILPWDHSRETITPRMVRRGKWYVVTAGARVGILPDWENVRAVVDRVSGSHHRSFALWAEADVYYRYNKQMGRVAILSRS